MKFLPFLFFLTTLAVVGSGLTVTPPTVSINAFPGETFNSTIQVKNTHAADWVQVGFEVDKEGLNILLDGKEEAFMVMFDSGEVKDYFLEAKVPGNIAPGVYIITVTAKQQHELECCEDSGGSRDCGGGASTYYELTKPGTTAPTPAPNPQPNPAPAPTPTPTPQPAPVPVPVVNETNITNITVGGYGGSRVIMGNRESPRNYDWVILVVGLSAIALYLFKKSRTVGKAPRPKKGGVIKKFEYDPMVIR